jgi:hypothetical protein
MRRDRLSLVHSLKSGVSAFSLIVSSASGWVSFLAYRDMMDGSELSPFLADFTAGVAGIACCTLLHFTNVSLFKGLVGVDRQERRRILPFLPVFAVMIASVSTYANVLTTAGSEALRIHNSYETVALEDVAAQVQGVSLAVGQLAAPLDSKGAELDDLAEAEASGGALTGAPGEGSLTDALRSASDVLEATAGLIAAARSAAADVVPELNAAIEDNDQARIRAAIATMRASIPFGQIDAAASRLEAGLGIEGTAANPGLRARQNEAIAQIEADLTDFARQMRAGSAEVQAALSAIEMPTRTPLSKAGAILRYWDQLIPQIGLGIGIDWMLIILALLIATIRDTVRGNDDEEAVITLADVRRLTEALHDIESQQRTLRHIRQLEENLPLLELSEEPHDGRDAGSETSRVVTMRERAQ